jgi:hypothetical protein
MYVCYEITVVCLCLSTCFTVTNGFIPFRLPLVDALSISFPGGRREVFLFLGLGYISTVNRNQQNNSTMDLPVELVGLLKHAGIDVKTLTWDLHVNSSAISVLSCFVDSCSL